MGIGQLFRQIGIPLSDRLHNLTVLRIGLYEMCIRDRP